MDVLKIVVHYAAAGIDEFINVMIGIVSAKDIKLGNGAVFIAVDSSNGPGWVSSGPMFDTDGKLVAFGPDMAILAKRRIGLFMPSDRVKRIVTQLSKNK